MQAVIDEFERRIVEVNAFFGLLRRLEDPDTALCSKSDPKRVARRLDENCVKVMKATGFLLIYNLIESGIRSSLAAVYDQIASDGKTLQDVRRELQRIWVDQQHSALDLFSASPRTYKEVTERVLKDVFNKAVIKLNAGDLPGVSGNLDAETIRKVCYKHGVSEKAHYKAQGGDRLAIVKDQRNALAHGDISFAECGQQYTVEDLLRIKQQAIVFVRSILRNIKRYADKQEYAA